MPMINKEGVKVLNTAIDQFQLGILEAYKNKPKAKEFARAKGFKVPSSDQIDDDVLAATKELDWLKENPQEMGRISTTLTFGIMQVIHNGLPEGAEDDPAFDPYFKVLQVGNQILETHRASKLN